MSDNNSSQTTPRRYRTGNYPGRSRYRQNDRLLDQLINDDTYTEEGNTNAQLYVDWFLRRNFFEPCPLSPGSKVRIGDETFLFYSEWRRYCSACGGFLQTWRIRPREDGLEDALFLPSANSNERYHPGCVPDPENDYCTFEVYTIECNGGFSSPNATRICSYRNFSQNQHHLYSPSLGFFHPTVVNGELMTCVVPNEGGDDYIVTPEYFEFLEAIREVGAVTVDWDVRFRPDVREPGNEALYMSAIIGASITVEYLRTLVQQAFNINWLPDGEVGTDADEERTEREE